MGPRMPERIYYRTMRTQDGVRPEIGRSRRSLGVVIDGAKPDIRRTADGSVLPDTGGMSVFVNDPHGLPAHRKPRWLKGYGKDPLFSLCADLLPGDLTERIEQLTHAFVEPAEAMPFEQYEAALSSTQGNWLLLTALGGAQ